MQNKYDNILNLKFHHEHPIKRFPNQAVEILPDSDIELRGPIQ